MKRITVRFKPAVLFFLVLFFGLLLTFNANGQPNPQEFMPTSWQSTGWKVSLPYLMEDEATYQMEALKPMRNAYQALPDTGQVDYRDYDIAVRLFPNRHHLEGDVQVIIQSKVTQLSRVDFQLYNDTLRIKSVTNGADTLGYTYTDSLQMLRVWLKDTLSSGQIDTLRIVYSGYITPTLSQRYLCQLDSTLGYTLPAWILYPIPYAYDFGNGPFSERLKITVPRSWRAVSKGGLLDSLVTDSTQTYSWGTTMAYTFIFAAGPYLMSTLPNSGITLRYYAFDTTDARNFLPYAACVLNFYSRAFGAVPIEKMAFADVGPRVPGAGGYTLILQLLYNPLTYWTMIHEVSHQWWGNLVGNIPDEAWLCEGFATYSEIMFREDSLGLASRKGRLDTLSFQYLDWVPPDSDKPIIPTPFGWKFAGNIVYAKGGWVLHMLRGVVGDSAFYHTMKIYGTRYQDSLGTVAKFRTIAEQQSGQNLGWFFDEWLYHTGAPRYTYAWQSRQIGVDTFQLTLWVNQLDSLFTMPIQTSIFTPGGRQDQWPLVAHRSDTFQFILTQAPDSVMLDKDDWLLDRGITRVGVEAGSPAPSLATTLLPVYPNPSRGSFRIEYTLARKSWVRLSVYNVSGQLVRELVNMIQPIGRYSASWDGRDREAHKLPSGVYFYRLQTEAFSDTKKAVVVR
jgi:aminopeptidase N